MPNDVSSRWCNGDGGGCRKSCVCGRRRRASTAECVARRFGFVPLHPCRVSRRSPRALLRGLWHVLPRPESAPLGIRHSEGRSTSIHPGIRRRGAFLPLAVRGGYRGRSPTAEERARELWGVRCAAHAGERGSAHAMGGGDDGTKKLNYIYPTKRLLVVSLL